MNMKKLAKSLVASILGWQVRRLRRRHEFKVIGVAGGIGKTSTKFAIVSVLSQKFSVRFQEGNYNDIVSVPLVFFNQPMPSLFNPLDWLKVFIKNEIKLRRKYSHDFVIVELGTDGPGQIAEFGRYLDLDIGILTAIVPEHMEYFDNLEAVATEELGIARLSKKLFVNTELCDKKYLDKLNKDFIGYDSTNAENIVKTKDIVPAKAQLFSAAAAAVVGGELGLSTKQVETGIKLIKPVSGRMRILQGINGSVIIDDTYNASPAAMKQSLDTLYKLNRQEKIALLGSMNELGRFSAEEHNAIGEYCDPKELNLVVTVGEEAGKYLAPAAAKKGCKIKTFIDPYQAGEYLKQTIKPETAILAKGSQNGIFAEEAVKIILAKPEDASKLVRQSPDWLAKKQKQFSEAKI